MKKIAKKLLCVVVAAVLCLSAFSTVSAKSIDATVALGDALALTDSSIVVPIIISENDGIMGFGLKVTYDREILIPVKADCSISGMFNDSIETSSAGSFDIFWCSTANSTHNGALFLIEFAVISGKSDQITTLSLDYYPDDTFDENYRDIALDCQDKTVDLSALNLNGSYDGRCDALGHDYQSVTVNATCTSGGYTEYTCKHCGFSYKEDGEPATKHSYSTKTVAVSCGSDGYTLHTCTLCGDEYKTDIVTATGHNYVLVNEDADGKYYQCSFCGNEKNDSYVSDQLSVSIKNFTASDDGRTLTIPVSISNNSGFMGLGLKVTYDSLVLKPVSVSYSDALKSGMSDDSISPTSNGCFDIFWSGTQNNPAEGEILQITFDVISDVAATTDINITPYADSIYDENWNDIETVCNGICLDTALYADANGDAKVDIRDIIRIKKHLAQSEKCTVAADINADGSVDIYDIIHLKKILLSCETLHNTLLVKQNLSTVDSNLVISQLKSLSCDIIIADGNTISDNNPYLPSEVGGYDITWNISNTKNYEILNNRLCVKDYTNIVDETLSVKAAITVADEVCEREFKINTKILRMNQNFLSVDSAGFSTYLKRNSQFNYIPDVCYAEYAGFSKPVKPVTNAPTIEYCAFDGDGSDLLYSDVFSTSNGKYKISALAPLGSKGVIKVSFGHGDADSTVTDYSYSQEFIVTESVYKVSFTMNGGKIVRTSDNSEITYEHYAEESTMFDKLQVLRAGYTFDGFYTDPEYTDLFCDSSLTGVIMPSQDINLFAKWTAKSFTVFFDPLEGMCETESLSALCDIPLGALPTAERTGYTFNGWKTASGEFVDEKTFFTTENDVTLYADWSANNYDITFNANGGKTDVVKKTVVYDSVYGTLPTVSRTGYTFLGWYTEENGGVAVTANTPVDITAHQTLFAHWQVIEYTVSWNTGVGYTITVNRTSSPNVGAATGNLTSGGKIYTGDVLQVTYSASAGYSITSRGLTSITVSGNITSSNIYATAKLNDYTYTVKYVSSNGTDLGSTSATHTYGTTNTITPPAKTGYTTPSAQSVKWDSTTAKTITFTYSPKSVSSPQYVGSGHWWYDSSTAAGVDYYVTVEFRNRKANSIEARVVWKNTITRAAYGWAQYYNAILGTASVSNIQIAAANKWPTSNGFNQNGSSTGTSGWVTISVSPTATSVSFKAHWWDSQRSGDFTNVFAIPAF